MNKNIVASVIQHCPGDMFERQRNVDYIIDKLMAMKEQCVDLVVFPEMGITNFFKHEEEGLKKYWQNGAIYLDSVELGRIKNVVAENNMYTVVGFAEKSAVSGVIYNSAALIGPKGIIGITRKINMPGIEKLYYTSGGKGKVFETEIGNIGVVICYDAMFPESFIDLANQDADIIVVTSSIWKGGAKGGVGHEEFKREYWDALPMVSAIQGQAFIVSCNACGKLDMGSQVGEWERLGLSKIVAPTGDVLAGASVAEEIDLIAQLNVGDLTNARTSYRFNVDRMLNGSRKGGF